MAGRPTKQGIDYFPLDVEFFSDLKVRKIKRACGTNSASILICLLCSIYKGEGYYILWDEDLPFVIADTVGVAEGAVREVVTKAIQVGFFDAEMFSVHGVLTSAGIQKRFLLATYQRKETCITPEYSINCANNSINCANNGQSKVKENRKKSKIKETPLTRGKEKGAADAPPPSASDDAEAPGPKTEKVPAREIKEMWNGTCTSFPKLISVSESRKNKMRLRIEEMGGAEKALPLLGIIFGKLQASAFLKGDNKRGWRASFDWLFDNGKNWVKVWEGNYDTRQDGESPKAAGCPGEASKAGTVVCPTAEEVRRENEEKRRAEHERVVGIYRMAKERPGSRYEAMVDAWEKNGMLAKHGLEPLSLRAQGE